MKPSTCTLLKRTAFCGTVAVLAVILVLLLVSLLSPYKCLLDVLNAAITHQCTFQSFYGGTPTTPRVRDVIPEIGALEDAFVHIRQELDSVLADHDRIPYMHNAYDKIFFKQDNKGACTSSAWQIVSELIYGPDTNIFDKIGSKDWRTFNLIMFNQDIPVNARRCPVTVSLLKRIPGMQSALFSIIAPGTYIPPHNDPGKGVIRYHLALKVPKNRERCFINVNGEQYNWTEGAGVLFDDIYDHWVLNDTDEVRVVLFVDILRPMTGLANLLQQTANFATRFYPGVTRAIQASAVTAGTAAK